MRLAALFATLSLTFVSVGVVMAAPTPAIRATVAPVYRVPAVAVPKSTATPAPTPTPWATQENVTVTFFELGPIVWRSISIAGGQSVLLSGPAANIQVLIDTRFDHVTIVKNNQTMLLKGVVVKKVSDQVGSSSVAGLVLQYDSMTWTTP